MMSHTTLQGFGRDDALRGRRLNRATLRRVLGWVRPLPAPTHLVHHGRRARRDRYRDPGAAGEGPDRQHAAARQSGPRHDARGRGRCARVRRRHALVGPALLVRRRSAKGSSTTCGSRSSTTCKRMPLAFFTRTQTGALQSRLNNDVIGAQQAVTTTLGTRRVERDQPRGRAHDHAAARVAAHGADLDRAPAVRLAGATDRPADAEADPPRECSSTPR